jgi:5-methylcytosine-specific restriction endonuclease McrA
MKICSVCKAALPVTQFHKNCSAKDKLAVTCKACTSARNKKWREDNPERRKATFSAWFEKNRERNRANCAAYYAENKEVLKAQKREFRQLNGDYVRKIERENCETRRDRLRASSREWARNNPDKRLIASQKRRAAKRNAAGSHTVEDIERIRKAQKGRCAACRSKTTLTVDHIIALSKGGSNWPSNIQLLCAPCNAGKNDKPNEQFFREAVGMLL